MFNFFSRKKPVSQIGLAEIGVDMHSHLIPGIDDGAKTTEDSISLIRGLQDLGFTKIITTPHVYAEHYPNTKEGILRGLDALKIAVGAAGLSIPIEASAEYFMDDHYEKILERNEILPLAGKYVLVEMSFFGAPPNLETYLFRTQTKGFQPILAHPERYVFLKGDMTEYEDLKEKGCLFQVNTLSLTGYYGEAIAQTAKKLVKAGLVDFLGTDMHHAQHLALLDQARSNKEFIKILDKYGAFRNQELLS